MIFPEHKASLHLTHNQHKAYYETVESYLDNRDCIDWVSKEQELKSYQTQELWELQWYPSTPIGSYAIYGADLDAVLAKALEVERNENENNRRILEGN